MVKLHLGRELLLLHLVRDLPGQCREGFVSRPEYSRPAREISSSWLAMSCCTNPLRSVKSKVGTPGGMPPGPPSPECAALMRSAELAMEAADTLLVLPWNLIEELRQQLPGMELVTAIPELRH